MKNVKNMKIYELNETHEIHVFHKFLKFHKFHVSLESHRLHFVFRTNSYFQCVAIQTRWGLKQCRGNHGGHVNSKTVEPQSESVQYEVIMAGVPIQRRWHFSYFHMFHIFILFINFIDMKFM